MKFAVFLLFYIVSSFAWASIVDYGPPQDALGHWEFDLYDALGLQRATVSNPVFAGLVYGSVQIDPRLITAVQLPASLGSKGPAASLSVTTAAYAAKNIVGNGTTVIKTGAGVLHLVLLGNNATGGTIYIYDNTAASGTVIFAAATGTPSGGLLSGSGNPAAESLLMDVAYSTGLTVVTAGSTTNNFTVVYY